MARLFVPACGDRLRLTAPWEFTLHCERRNVRFAQGLGLLAKEPAQSRFWEGWEVRPTHENGCQGKLHKFKVELPKGTVLECDRVYIRQFSKSANSDLQDDYDSITWTIRKEKGRAGKDRPSGRFWTKLPDCYGIEYELDSLYRDRVKAVREVHDR